MNVFAILYFHKFIFLLRWCGRPPLRLDVDTPTVAQAIRTITFVTIRQRKSHY